MRGELHRAAQLFRAARFARRQLAETASAGGCFARVEQAVREGDGLRKRCARAHVWRGALVQARFLAAADVQRVRAACSEGRPAAHHVQNREIAACTQRNLAGSDIECALVHVQLCACAGFVADVENERAVTQTRSAGATRQLQLGVMIECQRGAVGEGNLCTTARTGTKHRAGGDRRPDRGLRARRPLRVADLKAYPGVCRDQAHDRSALGGCLARFWLAVATGQREQQRAGQQERQANEETSIVVHVRSRALGTRPGAASFHWIRTTPTIDLLICGTPQIPRRKGRVGPGRCATPRAWLK